jgi:hypothetical protein
MMARVCLRHVGPNGDRWRFDLTLGPDLLPLARSSEVVSDDLALIRQW